MPDVCEIASPVTFKVITGQRWRERSVFQMDESSGLFMAETPWGTFSYYWPPAYRGCNLFQFLASLDFDYFMGKAAKQPSREIDATETVRRYRAELIQHRRRYMELDKQTTRELWDLLGSLEDNRSRDEFLNAWAGSPLDRWISVFDASVCERDTAAARAFWDGPWRQLITSAAWVKRARETRHERSRAA